MAIPVSELQKINPSSLIELFTVTLDSSLHGASTVYRFHDGSNMNSSAELIWDSNSYQRFPVKAEGFEFTGKGQIPRPKFTVSNALGTITALMALVNQTTAGNDLTGAKFTRIRTLARYIDAANFTGGTNPFGTPDTSSKLPDEIYFIDRKLSENRDFVEFELVSELDLLNLRLPRRQITRDLFPGVGSFVNG
jgi:lambda family phage minor tail protein L